MSSVQIRDVRKSFGNFEVLHGVSIPIEDGEFVVLVGPSGCGKSTLLRMLAGLENITSGTISIGEKVVNNVQPKERDIAMVFQNYALYPHMKVYDNMAYGLRNRGTPKDEIDSRVRSTARVLELSALLDRRPRELSGGQRQDFRGALDAFRNFVGARAAQLEREAHIVGDGHVRIERVVLEHHRNVALFRLDIVDDAIADRNRA